MNVKDPGLSFCKLYEYVSVTEFWFKNGSLVTTSGLTFETLTVGSCVLSSYVQLPRYVLDFESVTRARKTVLWLYKFETR